MNILTIGNGFVADHLPYKKIINKFYSYNQDEIFFSLDAEKPDVIINCIGKTGRPNIDWCEEHKTETYNSNIIIPLIIAEWCERKSIHFINVGSGCIYFGQSPNYYLERSRDPHYFEDELTRIDSGFEETDFANPKSFYSKTKYACDLMLGEMKNVSILRIRMPISTKNNPRNLINKLRGYNKIIDIQNSMTFMDDFVRCVDWVATNSKTGIYHITNPEPLTAAQIMQEYQKYKPEHKFDIITEKELDNLTTAKRSNCILNSEKLNKAGFTMSPSIDALKLCMSDYVKNI